MRSIFKPEIKREREYYTEGYRQDVETAPDMPDTTSVFYKKDTKEKLNDLETLCLFAPEPIRDSMGESIPVLKDLVDEINDLQSTQMPTVPSISPIYPGHPDYPIPTDDPAHGNPIYPDKGRAIYPGEDDYPVEPGSDRDGEIIYPGDPLHPDDPPLPTRRPNYPADPDDPDLRTIDGEVEGREKDEEYDIEEFVPFIRREDDLEDTDQLDRWSSTPISIREELQQNHLTKQIVNEFCDKALNNLSVFSSEITRIINESEINAEILSQKNPKKTKDIPGRYQGISDISHKRNLSIFNKGCLLKKTHNKEHTKTRTLKLETCKKQKARYLRAKKIKQEDSIDYRVSDIIKKELDRYEAKCNKEQENLYKYLNSMVIFMDEYLKDILEDIENKSYLYKEEIIDIEEAFGKEGKR